MVKTEVTLESGNTIDVRRLGMFELDDIEKNVPGPYTVSILFANGEVYDQVLDLETPRRKPDKPLELCDKSDNDYYDWREWLSWQEGLLHVQKQYEAYAEYLERIAGYVRKTCILTDIDHNEITSDDWDHIYQAALCPQVTMEDVTAALRSNFQLSI